MDNEHRRRIIGATLILFAVALAPILLWAELFDYINPRTATQRKDVVNMFVLSAAVVVGSLTALAAVGNLYLSRMNLQQQRELDDRRAQEDALQNYFQQMGELLTTHKLTDTKNEDDPLRLLARAHTVTVLQSVEGSRRKTAVALFLEGVGLIAKEDPKVKLNGTEFDEANLSGADFSSTDLAGTFLNDATLEAADLEAASLRGAFLVRTNLSGASLNHADLRNTFLSDANLNGAYLVGADLNHADLIDADLRNADLSYAKLSGAFLKGANLSGALVREAQLNEAENLESVIMPDGTELF